MPYGMSNTIQAVMVGDNVYVGGGYTTYAEDGCIVIVYSLTSGSWRMLPSS